MPLNQEARFYSLEDSTEAEAMTDALLDDPRFRKIIERYLYLDCIHGRELSYEIQGLCEDIEKEVDASVIEERRSQPA